MKVKSYTIDLSEQMAVCDANYIRLLKLLGNTRSLNERIIALPQLGSGCEHGVAGRQDKQNRQNRQEQLFVYLEVLENFKYTSTISIRQILSSQWRAGAMKTAGKTAVDTAGKTAVETLAGQNNTAESTNPDRESAAYYQSPEMIIRVYHDAKTAEVTSYQNHHYFKAIYPVPNRFMYQCDEKEQLNLFLAEWLNLCINEGLSNPDELHLENLIYH